MPLICMLQFVFFVISYQAYSRIRPDIVEGSFKRPSVFPLSVACTDRVRVALPILVSACAARANPQLATCHVRDVDADMSPGYILDAVYCQERGTYRVDTSWL